MQDLKTTVKDMVIRLKELAAEVARALALLEGVEGSWKDACTYQTWKGFVWFER
jgi:hypothetical protein